MRRDELPDEQGLIFILFRALNGWTQGELAEAVGTAPSVISEYESGTRRPSRKAIVRAAQAADVAVEQIDLILQALRRLRDIIGGRRHPPPVDPFEAAAEKLSRGLDPIVRQAVQAIRPSSPAGVDSPPGPEDREEAGYLWARLERYGMETRRLLVEEGAEYQTWALCELLCEESREAAEDGEDSVLELAELALHVAERVPGAEDWRACVQAFAWAHLGHARRERGDRPGAEEAFARFRELWQKGSSLCPSLLDDARSADLEALVSGQDSSFH